MNPYTLAPDLNGEGLHIGIVRARFNEEIGLTELDACLAELAEMGVDERDVMVVSVPGALELGVTLAQMAETFEFDALIALGAVIRGETYHFEIVRSEEHTSELQSLMRISYAVFCLKNKKRPLTTNHHLT